MTYVAPGSGEIVTDDSGNETRGAPVPKKVRAYLESETDPTVTAQIGADVVRVDYTGALTDPAVPPKDFTTGTAVTFTVDGRTVKGRVKVAAPPLIAKLDAKLGRDVWVVADG